MLVAPLIERKRDGGSLAPEEWKALIDGYVAGDVPDCQMSALLMAVVFRGLNGEELTAVVDAMLESGRSLSGTGAPRIDKHSTGGVGDKVSLILAPLVAACGIAIPMMSGRGLGHTGGTLDKLESIPGFRTQISAAEVEAQVTSIGLAMFGQSDEIVPADRKLYALRDVTGCVASVPLIAASIMSKKLAEGLQGLVLDIKRGTGAFLPALDAEIALGRAMIDIGAARGVTVTALVTAMDRPLGRACGNALEVEEAFLILQGEGPPDVLDVTLALGAEMLMAAGTAADPAAARERLEHAIRTGRAAAKMQELIAAQGGNPSVLEDPSVLPQAGAVEIYETRSAGYVQRVDPVAIGWGVSELGGGRRKVDDEIDHSVGFVITVKPGDRVVAKEPLASVFARDDQGVTLGLATLERAIVVVDEPPEPSLPLVSHRLTADGVEAFD